MEQTKVIYPYQYFHHKVYVVAVYGQTRPYVTSGNLVLRTYYKDDKMTQIDYKRTSEYLMDSLFYETNKIIRAQMGDPYSGKRKLVELSMPELGKEYRVIYNAVEEPSQRFDDRIQILAERDPSARGVAVILKRDPEKGITWLDEAEARKIAERLQKD